MRTQLLAAVILTLSTTACDGDGDGRLDSDQRPVGGQGATVFTAGDDPENPFFQELGTNGRTCATCHDRESGWSITPAALVARFDATGGTDPIFRPVDGAVSPDADVSTVEARRAAYRVLLDKGLIRVGLPVPANADFTLTQTVDPYGFASAAELSLFRRPLPSANLRFLSQVMWDTREATLGEQALHATMGHAEATSTRLDGALSAIVGFESGVYTAQTFDDLAGDLAEGGASGGPQALVGVAFRDGINDSAGAGFDRRVFTLFEAWDNAGASDPQGQRRLSIARGERVFNTETFRIDGVAGLPDQRGTCSTCHDTPNVGNHSRALPLDLGVSDAGRRTADLPLYTLTDRQSGLSVRTTDPGLALVTGRFADVGRFKVPVLRGLAMRAPYFHNGMAADLDDVVRFYTDRFRFRLSGQERADLIAFLSAL